MLYSLKKGSIFYLKKIQANPPPSLRSIYRDYIKSSLKIFKNVYPYFGIYFFKLLELKKTQIMDEYQKIHNISQIIAELENNKKNLFEQQIQRKNQQQKYQREAKLMKLINQKESMESFFRQNLLYQFQCLYYFSKIVEQSISSQSPPTLRYKQQLKLLYLSLNISKYFTPALFPRPNYHSLFLLQGLQEDMDYKILSQKDKGFVRGVITKVCGPKSLNHTGYRTAGEYLADLNAAAKFQPMDCQILLSDQNPKNIQNTDTDQDIIENDCSDQWRLISQQDRNKLIRQIFLFHVDQQTKQNSLKVSKKEIPKGQLFEILQSLDVISSYRANPSIRSQFNYGIKKLFKINKKLMNQVKDKQKLQKQNQSQLIPSLSEIIEEYNFIDQFVNQKKIIIV